MIRGMPPLSLPVADPVTPITPLDRARHRWVRRESVVLRSFGDEPLALAYDGRLGRTHLIDEMAAALLQALDAGPASPEDLTHRLLALGGEPTETPLAADDEALQRVAQAVLALADVGLAMVAPRK
jgi:PqqD family protein of HPr-rel-A system